MFRIGMPLLLVILLPVFPAGCSGSTQDVGAGDLADLGADGPDAAADRVCVPDCGERVCGDDGCSGSCGKCGNGQACQQGQCVPVAACEDGEACDDGDLCTEDDLCAGGLCAGQPYSCDDGKECTADICDGSGDCVFEVLPESCLINGVCRAAGEADPYNPCRECSPDLNAATWTNDDGNSCDDGTECTLGEQCAGGVCLPPAIEGDAACDDGDPCTADKCSTEEGKCTHGPASAPCDDGNACTGADACQDGKCAGSPADCGDGDPCTADACDPDTGCFHSPAAGDCEDGDPCTAGDHCEEGACLPGPDSADCDDQNVCTDDACTPLEGCMHAANAKPCDDGNPCTAGDYCNTGACLAGKQPPDCADGNPCTQDGCLVPDGCLHQPAPGACDDGNPCTAGDYCVNGECVAGTSPANCDDSDPCTKDTCSQAAGCSHTPFSGPCDDKNECTVNETCVQGICSGPLKSCDDGNLCTDDTCSPSAPGGCIHAFNDLPCEDGALCTLGDTCMKGACVSGLGKPNCDDWNSCTSDVCVPAKGCQNNAIVGLCQDGDACTTGDFCANAKCIAGPAVSCDDAQPCTQDSCAPATGCKHVALQDGTPCLTSGWYCAAGQCKQGPPPCPDKILWSNGAHFTYFEYTTQASVLDKASQVLLAEQVTTGYWLNNVGQPPLCQAAPWVYVIDLGCAQPVWKLKVAFPAGYDSFVSWTLKYTTDPNPAFASNWVTISGYSTPGFQWSLTKEFPATPVSTTGIRIDVTSTSRGSDAIANPDLGIFYFNALAQ